MSNSVDAPKELGDGAVSQDGEVIDSANPPKTAKQLEKDAKKLAKLEKLKQKQDKLASVDTKEKKEVGFVWNEFCGCGDTSSWNYLCFLILEKGKEEGS